MTVVMVLVALVAGVIAGFLVGRQMGSSTPQSGIALAVQEAVDAERARLAHLLSANRDDLVQLEAAVAQVRQHLENEAREFVGELPSTRTLGSRYDRPESGTGQPRDYAEGMHGMLTPERTEKTR